MLEDFDRQDVEELYRLVKERYSASRPEGYDLMLWGDLHTLFEPDEEDEICKNQHEYNVMSWSLYDFCSINILLMQNGIAIHMLTEKKYPLSQETITKMLNKRLEACSFMLCDLDFEPLSLSLSYMPSCDLVSLTNILILCLILKASNQSLQKSLSLNLELS
ncbi:hypothetical protein Tco_1483995 [Tanacetum coccineum]